MIKKHYLCVLISLLVVIFLLFAWIVRLLNNPIVETRIVEIINEVVIEKEVEPTYTYNVTSEEREMLARLLYREARGESFECQKAVISVVINRWINGYWGDTLYDVIYAKNQFSPSDILWKTTPSETQYAAVDDIIKNGTTLPEYVLFFRADRHFAWDGYCEYDVMGQTYFGYLEKDKQ